MNSLRNSVKLIGYLGADPEIKRFEGGKIKAQLNIATNETYRNAKGEKVISTQWHRLVAWGKTAEYLEKYTKKGMELAIEGRLSHRSYEDKEGIKKFITEVVINEALFLSKSEAS